MTELFAMIFSESWLMWGLLFMIIAWIWYGVYKLFSILIKLLETTLNSFLEKFWKLVESIIELTKKEKESQVLNTTEHNQNSEEHLKIIDVLNKILINFDK
jgi:hypothetical protein